MLRAAMRGLDWVRPPRGWVVPLLVAGGTLTGLAGVLFHISNASSYLRDDPEACVNCHIMRPQYATWERGSHARVATCNDCHVPHDSVVRKYAFKAMDGTRHATMFTFRMEPQVIRVHAPGIGVIQENCQRCHADLLHRSSLREAVTARSAAHGEGRLCWECHRETPHGRVNSLASVPDARVPSLRPAAPVWLKEWVLREGAGADHKNTENTHETHR
jgi:cytochrome c nitrite reductase small subunit